MRQSQDPIAMFESTKLLEAAFTAAATDIVTCSGHGFVTGDKIRVTTSGADLPAGLSTGTDYYIVKIDANTFYLNSKPGDSPDDRVNITDAGTGTHTLHLKSRVIDVEDFRHLSLAMCTAGNANFTIKIQRSNQENVDFESAASATNRWDYVQTIDNEDGSTYDGDTGFAPSGIDDNKIFAINIDAAKWVCLDVTTWTAGTISAYLTAFND